MGKIKRERAAELMATGITKEQLARVLDRQPRQMGSLREGYWPLTEGSELPALVARKTKWRGWSEFGRALTEIERRFNIPGGHPKPTPKKPSPHYRDGTKGNIYNCVRSPRQDETPIKCPLCDKALPAADYIRGPWQWPAGLRHLVRQHNVRPSVAFVEYILNRRLAD